MRYGYESFHAFSWVWCGIARKHRKQVQCLVSDFCDFSIQVNQKCLLDRLTNGEIAALWIGLDCGTWSRARRGKRSAGKKHGWPCALRGDTHETIYGVDDLKPHERKRVEAGQSSTN